MAEPRCSGKCFSFYPFYLLERKAVVSALAFEGSRFASVVGDTVLSCYISQMPFLYGSPRLQLALEMKLIRGKLV